MKKVGIIDNYISNWHANTYYKLFAQIAKEQNREEYTITHVYTVCDKSKSTGETTDEWCARTGAVKCDTIKEVCDSVDVIMVLAPDNPEMHEEMVQEPFKSGKPVYVDKTFAPDYATAKRIVEYGKACGTKFWSSSALRFDPNFKPFLTSDEKVNSLLVQGPNVFEIYSIHLIEIMNTIMKNGAKAVKCLNNDRNLVFEIEYKDGRKCIYHQVIGSNIPFSAFCDIEGEYRELRCGNDFWYGFAEGLMDYFDTGVSLVDVDRTVECIAVRSALKAAMANVGEVITVEGAE